MNKMQQEKKRKREDDNVKEKIEVEDGEKVFISSRTSRQHYQKVVQEMQYIKSMPVSSLITIMIEWTLRCEVKRQSSRNINGAVTRHMRECLIKLYYTLGEVQRQRETVESSILKKELNQVNIQMKELRKENVILKRELEASKENMGGILTPKNRKNISTETATDSAEKINKKVRRNKDIEKEKSMPRKDILNQ